jgi:hypothetical protein
MEIKQRICFGNDHLLLPLLLLILILPLQSHYRLNECIWNHTDSFGMGNWTVNARPEIQNCGTITSLSLNTVVTDLSNAFPGNSSVNTVQHATIGEAVFYVFRTTPSVCNGQMNSQSDT